MMDGPAWGRWARRAGLIALAVGLIAAARWALPGGSIEGAVGRIRALGPWAPVAFGLAYAVGAVAMLPGAPMTLAAGALFGPVGGAIVADTGATLGAAGAFLIARYVARDAVAARATRYPRWRALDRALAEGGWKVVALLRLSPAVPFNVQNYLYGLTPIGFWPCVLTSWLAMLPGSFLYASLGAAGAAAATGGWTRGRWALLGAGIMATLALTAYLGRLAGRAMEKEMTDDGSLKR